MPNNRKVKKLRGKKWKGLISHFKGYHNSSVIPCYKLEICEDSDIKIVFTDNPIHPWITF